MRSFFIGLQFLTRLTLVKQDNWTEEDFAASVRWFPLVGAVLGVSYVLFSMLPVFLHKWGFSAPVHSGAALTLVFTFYLTGGIFADGFMDTMDGLFSGRPREEMLAIMKDSRVGGGGVMGFTMLVLLDFALILDISPNILPQALFVMPVISRFMLSAIICLFPYARPQGLGKAFHACPKKKTLLLATFTTMLLLAPLGKSVLFPLISGLFAGFLFAHIANKKLGGLTGDTYGAASLIAETGVLVGFALMCGNASC